MAYRGGSVLAKSKNGSRAFSLGSASPHSHAGYNSPQEGGNKFSPAGSFEIYAQSEHGYKEGYKQLEVGAFHKQLLSNDSTKLDQT